MPVLMESIQMLTHALKSVETDSILELMNAMMVTLITMTDAQIIVR